MYTGLHHLHSALAYLLLAALVIAIAYILVSYINKKAFTDQHRKAALVALICTHLQLLFGLILYFVSPLGFSNISGEVMKDSYLRNAAVEHPLTMIVAIVLITVGYSKVKRLTDSGKRYKNFLIFYSLGLFLILLRIPWSVWP